MANSTNMPSYESSSPQPDYTVLFAAHQIIVLILNVLIITGNGLTLACFCRYRTLRRNKTILIANLSVADLCVGLSDFMSKVLTPVDVCLTTAEQFMKEAPTRLSIFASVFSLLVIALDKFIAIVFPLRYEALVTRRVLLGMIATAWGTALLMCLLSMLVGMTREMFSGCETLIISRDAVSGCILVAYAVIVVIMFSIYVQILREASSQRRRIRQSTAESSKPRMDKAQVGVLMILGSFILLFFPSGLQSVLVIARHPVGTSLYLSLIALEAVMLNSCLNVFVYAIYSRDFRQAYRNIFCCRNISISPN